MKQTFPLEFRDVWHGVSVQLVRWCYPHVPLVVGPCAMTAFHWTRAATHTLLCLVRSAETIGESTALPCAGQPCNGHGRGSRATRIGCSRNFKSAQQQAATRTSSLGTNVRTYYVMGTLGAPDRARATLTRSSEMLLWRYVFNLLSSLLNSEHPLQRYNDTRRTQSREQVRVADDPLASTVAGPSGRSRRLAAPAGPRYP